MKPVLTAIYKRVDDENVYIYSIELYSRIKMDIFENNYIKFDNSDFRKKNTISSVSYLDHMYMYIYDHIYDPLIYGVCDYRTSQGQAQQSACATKVEGHAR